MQGKSTYGSAKSTICKALEAGVSLIKDDGTFKGKTALANETAAKNEEAGDEKKSAKSDYEKALSVVDTLSKLYAKLNATEQAELRNNMIERFFK